VAGADLTVARQPAPTLGWAYPLLAASVSLLVAWIELSAWLSIFRSWTAGPLVCRYIAAAVPGAWAGSRRFEGRTALRAFLAFELPQVFTLGVLAVVPLFFTPKDPDFWRMLGSVILMHAGDGVAWGLAWWGLARFPTRN
jgi:hypothetical protein